MAAFKRITVLSDCFSSLTGSQLSEPLQLLTGWQYPDKLYIAKLDTNKINLSICFYASGYKWQKRFFSVKKKLSLIITKRA